MSTESLFDNYIFPSLDWLQLDCLRHACTQMSVAVKYLTGGWVHPASWEVLGGLLIVLAVLLVLRRRQRIAAKRSMAAGR
jgi:hypothetical protein